jgi:transcriptional regulator with XRE-family HTH domain
MKTQAGSKRRFKGAAMTGFELRRLRQSTGVSQAALGAEAGYHPVYIGAMEMGRSKITARAESLLTAALERMAKRP